MSGNLYFALDKVTAPEGSTIEVVMSIGESDFKLKPSPSRRNKSDYSVGYKTMKEYSPLADGSYITVVVKINFLDANSQPSATGQIELDPKNFLDQASFDKKAYDIPVSGQSGVTAMISMSLVTNGSGEPSGYGDCSDKGVAAAQETPRGGFGIDGAEEIVQSEGGRRHRRKKGTKDNADGSFIAADGTVHRRKHRSSRSESSSSSSSSSTPAPAPAPPAEAAPAEGGIEGAEEIVESVGGHKHRRKKGTRDAADGSFIAEDGTVHRRKHRSRSEASKSEEKIEEKKEEPKPEEKKEKIEEKKEEPKPEEKKEETKPEEKKEKIEEKKEEKKEEPKPEENKPAESTQPTEEKKAEESKPEEVQKLQEELEAQKKEREGIDRQVASLKGQVDKTNNWIRMLTANLQNYAKTHDKSAFAQSFSGMNFPFPASSTDNKFGSSVSPSQVESDNQKFSQTGQFQPNQGMVNLNQQNPYSPLQTQSNQPVRTFNFSTAEEIPQPESFFSKDGLTLSHSQRTDCFFRPHYNPHQLDISEPSVSHDQIQNPLIIEDQSLCIDCKFNPRIQYNSGNGGYPEIVAIYGSYGSSTNLMKQVQQQQQPMYQSYQQQQEQPSMYQSYQQQQEQPSMYQSYQQQQEQPSMYQSYQQQQQTEPLYQQHDQINDNGFEPAYQTEQPVVFTPGQYQENNQRPGYQSRSVNLTIGDNHYDIQNDFSSPNKQYESPSESFKSPLYPQSPQSDYYQEPLSHLQPNENQYNIDQNNFDLSMHSSQYQSPSQQVAGNSKIESSSIPTRVDKANSRRLGRFNCCYHEYKPYYLQPRKFTQQKEEQVANMTPQDSSSLRSFSKSSFDIKFQSDPNELLFIQEEEDVEDAGDDFKVYDNNIFYNIPNNEFSSTLQPNRFSRPYDQQPTHMSPQNYSKKQSSAGNIDSPLNYQNNKKKLQQDSFSQSQRYIAPPTQFIDDEKANLNSSINRVISTGKSAVPPMISGTREAVPDFGKQKRTGQLPPTGY